MLGFVFLILSHTFLWIPLLRLKHAILIIATLLRLKSLPELDAGDLMLRTHGEPRRSDDRSTAAEAEEEMCSICLTELARGDSVCELTNCGHVFHFDCIEKWFEKNRFTCPLCRCAFKIQNPPPPRLEKNRFRFVVPDNPSCLYYFLQ